MLCLLSGLNTAMVNTLFKMLIQIYNVLGYDFILNLDTCDILCNDVI